MFDSMTNSEKASLVALARIKHIDKNMIDHSLIDTLYKSPMSNRLARTIIYDLEPLPEDEATIKMILSVAVIP